MDYVTFTMLLSFDVALLLVAAGALLILNPDPADKRYTRFNNFVLALIWIAALVALFV